MKPGLDIGGRPIGSTSTIGGAIGRPTKGWWLVLSGLLLLVLLLLLL
jgi:hypothetical protein